MKHRHAIFTVLLLFGLASAAFSAAQAEWDVTRTLKLENPPRDVAVSANGRWIFVLTDPGHVLIYSADGELKESITVGDHVDAIKVGPREDTFFLTSRKDKTVQEVVFQLVQEIDVTGSPFKGPVDAPVVIVVFNDFQCPYCAKLLPLYQQVFEKYPKQVKLVFKHFPLRNHAFAGKAAMAAIAADRQGKFWQFQAQLFDNFNKLSDQKIEDIALGLGLNQEQFEKDRNDPTVGARINQDLQDGRKAGVRGTPTIFVNGKLLKQKSLEGFRAMIEKELEKTTGEDR